MPLHYTKSGNLDMRYSSSREAVGSGNYSASGSSGRSSYGNSSHGYGSSFASSNLHYKKDGSLDMRYASSRESASYASPPNYSSGRSGYSSALSPGDLHYKKDGSLDMRFASSRQSASYASPPNYSSGRSRYSSSSGYSSALSPHDLHYKKDGSLDMRYASSKTLMSTSASSVSPSAIHLKKDGSLDMRYKSSQEMTQLGTKFKDLQVSPHSDFHFKKDGTLDMRYKSSKEAIGIDSGYQQKCKIPSSIPLTKSGFPDMRTNAAKLWVRDQGKHYSPGMFPSWMLRKKDGAIDTTNAAVKTFIEANNCANVTVRNDHTCREKYYKQRNFDAEFRSLVSRGRQEYIEMPRPYILPHTDDIRRELSIATTAQVAENSDNIGSQIPSSIPLFDYAKLKTSFADEEKCLLGRGSFGVVLKGMLNGLEVAVKRLHLTKLTKKENRSFIKELTILALLGDHPNLVQLYGYTLDPPCIVMEYVELGNLKHLLHYSEDPAVEAKLTDGRIKKCLAIGISSGMCQLHAANIVHGDLKPDNVLVTSGYVAKVSDFGLATLRGKTTSSVASTVKYDGETAICGTVGYMAPELLESCKRPELSVDVYSFGVLLNELIQEEEPYEAEFTNFRGPFAPVIFAKNGNRPYINQAKTPQNLQNLIKVCWSAVALERPTFKEICKKLQQSDMKFPNSF